MPLPAGKKLGPYEVLAPLGAGGMGEVYRARDSRLDRIVAIKILPPELSNDADRVSRFEREARAASALNHPAIVSIYDIARVDSASVIVMELVDGKTLRELLASGPLPMRRLLPIVAQVADGLAKAHPGRSRPQTREHHGQPRRLRQDPTSARRSLPSLEEPMGRAAWRPSRAGRSRAS
jgi:serine/threonine protein kinase